MTFLISYLSVSIVTAIILVAASMRSSQISRQAE
jgi:hypothetical protein